MKSKALYFSISKPLMIENIRRLWAIPVLSFLVYFLSGVFPILMAYGHLNSIASYIEMSLNNQQPFYMFAHLMFPIVTGVILFRYLQSVSSVSVMHSMPFTRAKLYNSSFISGLILIISPIIVNGIILLAISKPVYREYGVNNGVQTETVNLFARGDILNWIWVSIIIVIVVYAVSVFAGLVTGNSLMHFATAVWFNFLIPALYAVFIAYFSHFLYGFDTQGSWIDFGMSISPFLKAIQDGGEFGAGVTLYYFGTFLLLYGITFVLYQKRKLEHASDSLAFSFMEPIICYLISFLGMTALGFYFEVLGESDFYMYAGLAAGTLIFFILGQMIVKKTPRIFNLRSLRSFGIYALIAIVFIVGINVDATGFERRVPAAEKVNSFLLTEDFSSNYNPYRHYFYYNNNENPDFKFKDPDNIRAAAALHQSILNNRSRFEEIQFNQYTSSVRLEYHTGFAFPMSRRYLIDFDFFKNSPDFKQIYESKEYKELYSLKNFKFEKIKSIYINTQRPNGGVIELINQAEISEFMNCLEKDFQAQSFEDMVSLKHSYAVADINYIYKNMVVNPSGRMLDGNLSYKITNEYKNTIKWLKDRGYSGKLEETAENIDYIEIYHHVSEPSYIKRQPSYVEDTKMFNTQDKSMKITDPEQIKQILEIYETQNINYYDYYYGMIYYKGTGMSQQENIKQMADDPYFAEKQADIDVKYSNYGRSIYFNEGNIPDFILEYLK